MDARPSKLLHFDAFVLDVLNCTLTRESEEIRIRPKPFDVLAYLTQHTGRLVTKDELIQAVWPDVFVTDDSLVQCIGEIRKALDDTGHRIIKTVPRRGYMFAAGISATGLSSLPVSATRARTPELPANRWGRWQRRRSPVAAGLLAALVCTWVGWAAVSPPRPSQVPIHSTSSLVEGRAAVPRENSAQPERRVALVIGNSNYVDGSSYPNTRRDAEALARELMATGFEQVMVRSDLTKAEFSEALDDFAREANTADWAVVYYAGRGVEVGGVSYLLPINVDLLLPVDVSLQGMPLNDVLQKIRGAGKLRLVMIDACRDNPFGSAAYIPLRQDAIDPEIDGPTLVAFATGHGRPAEEGPVGNGPFATALIKNLRIPGLEIDQLFRKIRDDVLMATGNRQKPHIYGTLSAEKLYFRRPS
jgi:DNA-binding winged helix-turn-helix (wHTH) protein